MQDEITSQRGRQWVIAAFAVALAHALILGVLEAVVFGTEKLALDFLGLMFVIGLCRFTYRGYSFARWFFVAFFGAGGAWALVTLIRQPSAIGFLAILHTTLCSAAAGMLGLPRSVSVFLRQQRVTRITHAHANV